MKYYHIKDIDFKSNINGRVFGIFLATDVDVRTQKDGQTRYISLNMQDKDLRIDAKKFSVTDDDVEYLKSGHVYCAAIDIKEYKRSPLGFSCTLYNFEEYTAEEPSTFIAWADGLLVARDTIQNTISELSGSIYKTLAYNLIVPNWYKFSVWSAASSFHHDILGGLMVHTAEVIDNSKIIGDYWDKRYGSGFINKPLLLAAALLHDIAKIDELNVDQVTGTTEYSTESVLGSHITMAVSMIDIEAYKEQLGYQIFKQDKNGASIPTKPDEQVRNEKEAIELLKHCILAHHGKKEYGSPIDMNCPEAVILNTADNLSAAMYRFNKNFKTMDPSTSQSIWTSTGLLSAYKDYTKTIQNDNKI